MTTSKRTVSACVQCGLCNTVDPIMGITRKESAGTRFKAVLAKRGETSPLFYLTTDQGMQEAVCPAGIALGDEFRKARERNVAAGVTTDANETMRANFIKSGFPYDTMDAEDYRDRPIW